MGQYTAPPERSRLLPLSRSGKLAGALLVMATATFAAFLVLVSVGERGGDTFFSNLWLTGPILLSALSALAAGGTGIAALRHRDRSIVVFVAVLAGIAVALWTAAEIAFPH